MFWLNIFDNQSVLMAAEMLVIVIGSMLMGILLSYLYWGGMRKKVDALASTLHEEIQQGEELRGQVKLVSQIRMQLQSEMNDMKAKSEVQAKTIYDQYQYIYSCEAEIKKQKAAMDGLHSDIDAYQHRLGIIEAELEKAKSPVVKPKKTSPLPAVRANYEHVSKLLGRQVTENDLTLITGIGPKTATLLQTHGIHTWEDLARTSIDTLRGLLTEAGGIYKSQDPTDWAKQAIMAAKGEWRKLRVFQESLRKNT